MLIYEKMLFTYALQNCTSLLKIRIQDPDLDPNFWSTLQGDKCEDVRQGEAAHLLRGEGRGRLHPVRLQRRQDQPGILTHLYTHFNLLTVEQN